MKAIRTLAAAVAITAIAITGTARAATPSIWTASHSSLTHSLGRLVSLPASTTPLLAGSRFIGPMAGGQKLSLAISLRPRDKAGLDALVRAQYTPGSASYRQWLTPPQFAARFAPAQAQRQQVLDWLRGHGFRVTYVAANGLTIDAEGTAVTAAHAFHTALGNYSGHGERFFANARPLWLPQALAAQVSGVEGLDNAARVSVTDHLRPLPADYLHRHDYSDPPVTPSDLQAVYDFKPFYDNNLDGENQTIAVLENSDYSDSDLANFDAKYNLPPVSIERVQVEPLSTSVNSDQTEAELDLEVIHAIAPAAHLIVYEANPTNSLKDWVDIWTRMVLDNRATAISMSYGLPEFAIKQSFFGVLNVILEEAASQGQASFTSTGDHGAYDGHRSAFKKNPNYNKLITHFPSTSPWVTAVGGTMWSIDNQGDVTESGWSEQGDSHTSPAGGGGGVSAINQRPWYQQGPGVDNQYTTGGRETPDVSALAGSPGYAIYTVNSKGRSPGLYIITGTSAATPLWAAYDLLLTQSLNERIGFLNPSLYLLGQKASTFQSLPFNDVSQGDNLYYPATPAYDLATGWGSMDGAALHDDLVSAGPVVTHPANFTIAFFTASGKLNGKWQVIHSLKRGQTAYLIDRTSWYDVPLEDSPGSRTYTIADGPYTLVNLTKPTTVHHSALGKITEHHIKFTVPTDAPAGTYTIRVALTVGQEGWNNAASATITVS